MERRVDALVERAARDYHRLRDAEVEVHPPRLASDAATSAAWATFDAERKARHYWANRSLPLRVAAWKRCVAAAERYAALSERLYRDHLSRWAARIERDRKPIQRSNLPVWFARADHEMVNADQLIARIARRYQTLLVRRGAAEAGRQLLAAARAKEALERHAVRQGGYGAALEKTRHPFRALIRSLVRALDDLEEAMPRRRGRRGMPGEAMTTWDHLLRGDDDEGQHSEAVPGTDAPDEGRGECGGPGSRGVLQTPSTSTRAAQGKTPTSPPS